MKQLLKKAPAEVLKDLFSGLTLEMFENEMQKAERKWKGHSYPEKVKSFALAVHFYSPKDYSFIRKMYSLPTNHHKELDIIFRL